jgi:hypothetical protein
MTTTSPDDIWTPFLGQDPLTYALPDYYANYFAYSFNRHVGEDNQSGGENYQNIGLRIKGEFGYARYMSYNIYNTLAGESVGALTDYQIAPDAGNVNPYLNGCDPDAENRLYTIIIQPGDVNSKPPQNTLFYNGDDIQILTVIIRYYVPKETPTANVSLPTITAFDINAPDTTVDLPPPIPIKNLPSEVYSKRLKPIFETVVDETLRFYHVEGGGQFNNADNAYLVNGVERKPGEVLLMWFKPPTYTQNNDQLGETDVRYWSINQGNFDTSTPAGRMDECLNVAADGLVYIAMGEPSVQSQAEQGGFNFMLWQATSARAVILYRNLLTSQEYEDSGNSMLKVPIWTSGEDIYSYDACNTIASYAPTGKKVSNQDFIQNYGGIVPPK